MIFDSDDEYVNQSKSRKQEKEEFRSGSFTYANPFSLTDEHKNNMNKRLPLGFSLVHQSELKKLDHSRKTKPITIRYQPLAWMKKEIEDPVGTFIRQKWAQMNKGERKNRSVSQSCEGRSRQVQKIKNIIVRFRKYSKYQILAAYFNKVGLIQGLNQIESQNKRSLLTIDTFRDRMTLVLETAKQTTYEQNIVEVIDEMIQQLQCYCEQARKSEFQKNVQSIQKSIDKITRFVNESNDALKSMGLTYSKKKRKAERTEPYQEKELIYLAELIKQLPSPYWVGIWQIIFDKPFCEITEPSLEFSFDSLHPKKIREIQLYVKSKHSLLWRSRERKKEKFCIKKGIPLKKEEEEVNNVAKDDSLQEFEQNQNESYLNFQNNQNESQIDFLRRDEEEEVFFAPINLKLENCVKNQSPLPRKYETPEFKQSELKIKQQEEEQLNKNVFQTEKEQIIDSSDSSMITDQDDSDF